MSEAKVRKIMKEKVRNKQPYILAPGCPMENIEEHLVKNISEDFPGYRLIQLVIRAELPVNNLSITKPNQQVAPVYMCYPLMVRERKNVDPPGRNEFDNGRPPGM